MQYQLFFLSSAIGFDRVMLRSFKSDGFRSTDALGGKFYSSSADDAILSFVRFCLCPVPMLVQEGRFCYLKTHWNKLNGQLRRNRGDNAFGLLKVMWILLHEHPGIQSLSPVHSLHKTTAIIVINIIVVLNTVL